MKESRPVRPPRDDRDPAAAPGAPAPEGDDAAAGAAAASSDAAGEQSEGGGGEATSPGTAPAPLPTEPDYKDRWLRAEAELQNFRRRASREWDEGRRLAEEDVLLDMVAALDDLERALEAANAAGAAGSWSDGVALVAQRLRDGLSRRGVTVEDPLGRPFDPTFHEALLEVLAPAETAPGTVVQVVHKGYRRGDRALRAARVVVAKAPAGEGR